MGSIASFGEDALGNLYIVDLDGDVFQIVPDADDGLADGEDNCTRVSNPDQRDTDGDGIGNTCDCDFNQDGFCGGPDFTLFIGGFNGPPGP
jgi:hypothetical protein